MALAQAKGATPPVYPDAASAEPLKENKTGRINPTTSLWGSKRKCQKSYEK
jgi:hypothetical protein